MLNQIMVGTAVQSDTTGALGVPLRRTRNNSQAVADAQPRYAENANRSEVFSAASQSGATLTVGLATTYTGFILINPIGSGVNAEVIYATAALSIAATVPGPIGLIGGGSTAGVTAYTAIAVALWGSTKLDANAGTNGSKCAVAAAGITLVGAPRYVAWLGIAGTVATTSDALIPGILVEFAGMISVGPGGYLAFGSLVAEATALYSFFWRESVQ